MPKKILLADDSITIQKVIGLTFANEDVVLTVVDNGDEAIIKAKEIIPDLIIADVVMPGKDGYEVCYSSKNEPALAHVPVLLLTGTFETFDETMATKVGADGFITKPFESQALIDKVNELIGTAEQKREGAAGISASDFAGDQDSFDAPAAVAGGSEMLEAVEPLDTFDDIAPLEDIAPMDDIAPLEEIAAFEDMAPMELDDLSTEPEPVEEDPMAGFGHLTPDAEETSFADVTLEEAAAEEAVSHDDLLPETEPEPMEMLDEPAPAVELPEAPADDSATASSASAGADSDGGWNLSTFNDYMAEKTPAASAPAPAEPAVEQEAAPVANLAPAEDDFLSNAAAAEEPAAIEELPAFESELTPEPEQLTAEPEAVELDAAGFGAASETNDADAFGTADSFSAEELPEGNLDGEVSAPADDFQTTPAFDAGEDDLPASVEELPDDLSSTAVGAAEADMDLPASLDETPITDEPLAMESAADEFLPVAADVQTEFAAPQTAPKSIELSPDDGDMELLPVAPDTDMPLQQVADLYPLEDSPASVDLSAEEPVAEFATEPAMTDELPDEPVSDPVIAAAAPAPAAAVVQAPAAGPSIDAAALEEQLGRIPDLIEGRVKSMLENDALIASLGDKTGKLVEAKIEEAIRKVAPDIIEQLVKKAIADATERILNETIGRLRNG